LVHNLLTSFDHASSAELQNTAQQVPSGHPQTKIQGIEQAFILGWEREICNQFWRTSVWEAKGVAPIPV
jgi:hypothetical protein